MNTSDNTPLLQNSRLILSAEQVLLTREYKDFLGGKQSTPLIKNARSIFVYRIVYRSQGHNVVGYVVEPRKGKNLPCVIYNRGGSGEFGTIKIWDLFNGIPAQLAMNGYIVIASQYSGNAGSEGTDELGGDDIEDVINLRKVLDTYRRADAKRIGMYGGSRGGMMTYLALKNVRWIRAAVTVGASSDMFREEKIRPELKALNKKMFGGSITEKKRRSAVYWPDMFPKKTPLLMMHGGSDWRVSPLDSIELAQKLLALHVPCRLVLFEGADHGLSEHYATSLSMTISWFDRFVKGDERLPDTKLHGR